LFAGNPMSAAAPLGTLQSRLRSQLADRRLRLERSISAVGRPDDLVRLLHLVDTALSRVEAGHFGRCEVCEEDIDEPDLLAHPMAAYCLCQLTADRQRALENDLGLAWRVQAALLPFPNLAAAGWRTHYRYLPHGPVSGDYCDLIAANGSAGASLYFLLGDVSGKGVAASLLMAHLNAAFRALVESHVPPRELVARANRLLSESTLSSHYATLVCGRASAAGEVEIVNAGHCAPLIVRRDGGVETLPASGLPLGLAPAGMASGYSSERVALRDGDTLVLYTDGLTESVNSVGEEYGAGRLSRLLDQSRAASPQELVHKSLQDHDAFRAGHDRSDDLTILALRRESEPRA
jgi:sigma-B regulation protein RsbU (phosphoserine phosphatase)